MWTHIFAIHIFPPWWHAELNNFRVLRQTAWSPNSYLFDPNRDAYPCMKATLHKISNILRASYCDSYRLQTSRWFIRRHATGSGSRKRRWKFLCGKFYRFFTSRAVTVSENKLLNKGRRMGIQYLRNSIFRCDSGRRGQKGVMKGDTSADTSSINFRRKFYSVSF